MVAGGRRESRVWDTKVLDKMEGKLVDVVTLGGKVEEEYPGEDMDKRLGEKNSADGQCARYVCSFRALGAVGHTDQGRQIFLILLLAVHLRVLPAVPYSVWT